MQPGCPSGLLTISVEICKGCMHPHEWEGFSGHCAPAHPWPQTWLEGINTEHFPIYCSLNRSNKELALQWLLSPSILILWVHYPHTFFVYCSVLFPHAFVNLSHPIFPSLISLWMHLTSSSNKQTFLHPWIEYISSHRVFKETDSDAISRVRSFYSNRG